MSRFVTDFWLPCAPSRAFAFFGEAGNLNRVTPPWFRFEILTPQPITMAAGTRIDYRLRWRFAELAWSSRVTEWTPGVGFAYEQARGPFSTFRHDHRFTCEAGGVRIADRIDFRLPFGGRLAERAVAADLRRVFSHRARRAALLLTGTEVQESEPAAPSRRPRTSASSSAIEEPT